MRFEFDNLKEEITTKERQICVLDTTEEEKRINSSKAELNSTIG